MSRYSIRQPPPANSARLIDAGAFVVNVRSAPVPVPGGHRSPFDPAYDPFWRLAAEAGVLVATHAGIDGYDALVQMWEPGQGESSLFRSPLRGIVTKGRAVGRLLRRGDLPQGVRAVPRS